MLASQYVNLRPALRIAPALQGVISGYLAIWGSPDNRDAYGTWFDRENPPNLGLNGDTFLPVRLMFEHGESSNIGRDIIGSVDRIWQDQTGIAFEAQLDRTSPYFDTVVRLISNGNLKVSSASSPHLASFDEEKRFVDWYLTEISLTENPAEPRMTSVQIVRTQDQDGDPDKTGNGAAPVTQPIVKEKRKMLTLAALGLSPESTLEEVMAALTESFGADAAKAILMGMMGGAAPKAPEEPEASGELTAPAEERSATPAPAPVEQRSAPRNDRGDPTLALQQDIAALRAEFQRMRTAPPASQPAPAAQTRVQVGNDLRYAHLSPEAMSLGYQVMRARRDQPSEGYVRNMAGKWGDRVRADRQDDPLLKDPALRSVVSAVRANEVATSTASGGGDEWVSIFWSTSVWETARHNLIFDQLVSKGMIQMEVPQGSESVYIPTEGADPTVYTIAQDADLAASGRPDVNVQATRIGTGRVLLAPGELGLAVAWTDTFDEDSIISVAPQYQRQIQLKAAETVEQLFINGDTETGASTNINLIDGTPGTGLSTPYYIASNGALKYCLVTASSYSRDGGAIDESDYRLTLKLLPAALRTRFQNLTFIIDPDVHSASLDIAAIKTEDVRRTNATIASGVLQNIWGVDVAISGMMPLANSAGKVPNAGGTLGRILAVYSPYWAVGWKRRIRVETDRDILSGANLIVAKMRIGFAARGAGASAVSYNLTV